MPITLNCPKCRKPFRVRDESVGMRVKCPTCAAVLQVPPTLSSTSMDGSPSASSDLLTPAPIARSATPPPQQVAPNRESVLTGLPGSASTSGPPSLPIRREPEDEPVHRMAPATTLPPIPNTRRPASKQPPVPRPQRQSDEQVEQIVEDAAGFSSVRGGLRWIQIGLFFSMIYAFYQFGLAIYAFKEHGDLPKMIGNPPPGLLEIKKINLFVELEIFTEVGSGVLLFFFGMIGLLKCMRIPDTAGTRGLVSGTFLLALLSFVGFLIICLPDLRRLFEIPELPIEVVAPVTEYRFYLPALVIVWYVLFLGQTGAVLRSGKVLTDAAFSALLIVVVVVGTRIGDNYYPLTMASNKATDEKMLETYLIETGIFALVTALIAFRLMTLSGVVRKVIWRWKEENAATLAAAAE